jgi:petrobactin synthase
VSAPQSLAIVEAIRSVLAGPLSSPHMARFSPEARLNEDLNLDSVLVLNLVLNLETQYGLEIPERALSKEHFSTVGALADLIAGEPEVLPDELLFRPIPEEEIDIKVHCVVSCLAAGIKANGLDHRPFYMGVWDTDFAVGPDHCLTYHAECVTHDHFLDWFRRIYGVQVRAWYDHAAGQAENIERLEALLASKSETEHLMVMLDMFHLPERENKFNQNPFPHYVMLERTEEPDVWFMHDPDFRWEGRLARSAVLEAISQPTVSGGYIYDRATGHAPDERAVRDYFLATFESGRMPLIEAVARIIRAHTGVGAVHPLGKLAHALRELPVIGIRKYAYEHGFAYFGRALGTSEAVFEARCEEIENLQQGLRRTHYLALKLAETGEPGNAEEALSLLERLWHSEHQIKAALRDDFDRWAERLRSGAVPAPAAPLVSSIEDRA